MNKRSLLAMAVLVASLPAAAETGFLVREETNDMYRTCVYETTKGEYAITIDSTRLCPLTIRID